MMGWDDKADGNHRVSAGFGSFIAPPELKFLSVTSSTSSNVGLILLTLAYYAAYFGYSIATQIITIGGIFQNPAIIALNALTYENYEEYNATNYVTAFILFFSGLLSFASVAKLASMLTIIQIYYYGGYDTMRVILFMTQIVSASWLPEFLYYVLPPIATCGYMLSMTL